MHSGVRTHSWLLVFAVPSVLINKRRLLYACLTGNFFPSYALDCFKYLSSRESLSKLLETICFMKWSQKSMQMKLSFLPVFPPYRVLLYYPHPVAPHIFSCHTSKLPEHDPLIFLNIKCYSRKFQHSFDISSDT